MPPAQLHLITPEPILEFIRSARLGQALEELAGPAEAELSVLDAPGGRAGSAASPPGGTEVPIRYSGKPMGKMVYLGNGEASPVARAEAVGVLTATERIPGDEFTARDCKLLDGLAATGASALMNCRWHAAAATQMMSTIQALASAVDAKDQYTHAHSARVAQLCVATARELGLSDGTICRQVELAGLLHDIGKIGIPDAILSKKTPLSPQEYAVVKTHADIGAAIVEPVAQAIRHHHERYDGLGYPSGLAGEAIPFAARLIAVTDVFDTLTSERPYRKCGSAEHALRELCKARGTQMDPAIVEALVEVIIREEKGRRPQTEPQATDPR